jgi:hypothetical protein
MVRCMDYARWTLGVPLGARGGESLIALAVPQAKLVFGQWIEELGADAAQTSQEADSEAFGRGYGYEFF